MPDKYLDFADLARNETQGISWRIDKAERPDSSVLIIAPHGGSIERGTSELAASIAGEDYSLYCFEGLKPSNNRDLHITSHRFDEPSALQLTRQATIVLGIHGCQGDEGIYVGGLDVALKSLIADALVRANLPARTTGHVFPATHPANICNRSSRHCGAQVELTRGLRQPRYRQAIAGLLRQAIQTHLTSIMSRR